VGTEKREKKGSSKKGPEKALKRFIKQERTSRGVNDGTVQKLVGTPRLKEGETGGKRTIPKTTAIGDRRG